MGPHPPDGTRRALLNLYTFTRVYTPRSQPWPRSTFSTTRFLSTTARHYRRARFLAIGPHHVSHDQRAYATTSGTRRPKNIAVLGGGLTGLSTAYYLIKFMPDVKVTIYEATNRLGGWIDSKIFRVGHRGPDGAEGVVTFERGARTVQARTSLQTLDDIPFYELLVDIPSPGKKFHSFESLDRYIYYPNHLVRLPRITAGLSDPVGTIKFLGGLVGDAFREPIYDGVLPFLWNMWRTSGQVPSLEDVSIGEEFLRKGGRREPIDNMVSALCHGIYGGDVWKLSAESSIVSGTFMNARMWANAPRWSGPKTGYIAFPSQDTEFIKTASENVDIAMYVARSRRIKSINFDLGFHALIDGIVDLLKASPKVKFIHEPVAKLRLSATGKMEVTTTKPSSRPLQYDKVVSSLYAKTLASLAPRNSLASLESSTAVTIRLVNLWSPTPDLNHKTKGFGYLLPQTVPAEQNPHAALGVIFDSDRRRPSHDLPVGDTLPGTKLTVMLGGHHWADLPASFLPAAATDDDAAVAAAKDTVRIQLGISPEAWELASTKLCVDCIPQHLVGHSRRMSAADRELRTAFAGKLAVVGGSYTSQGVLGSVRAARDVAKQISGGYLKVNAHPSERGDGIGEVDTTVGETGLARFVGGTLRHWVPHPVDDLRRIRTANID